MNNKITLTLSTYTRQVSLLAITSILLFSCAGSKKLKDCEHRYSKLDSAYRALQMQYRSCEDSSAMYISRMRTLNEQTSDLRNNNKQILDELKDLSVISGSQAESIKSHSIILG